MNKVIGKLAAGLVLSLGITTAANATVVSFVQEADIRGEQAIADGTVFSNPYDLAGNPSVLNYSIELSANNGYAYYDHSTGSGAYIGPSGKRGPGGLGVCGDPTSFGPAFPGSASNTCDPSSDDNVSASEGDGSIHEEVFVKFLSGAGDGVAGLLVAGLFHNADHMPGFAAGALIDYTLDGGASWLTTALTNVVDFGSAFFAGDDGVGFRHNNAKFYVSALDVTGRNGGGIVPLPASAPLMIGGLALLGAMRKRRKAKASS